MIGYMSLEEQVDADFIHARRKAFLRTLVSRLRSDLASARLSCFEDTSRTLGAQGGIRLGRRVVRSTDVVGSVGRCSEFDRAFLPTRASTQERWKRVDRIFLRAEELPPVSLFGVGGSYFVLDGNHRVSVYRYHGVEWIDAEVTEFGTPSPVEPIRPRTIEEPRKHMMPNEPSEVEDPKMHETVNPREEEEKIEVRWGLHEDGARIAELMELNGMRRALAFEERFIVAEEGGKILAALRYRTEPKRLLLGLLVSDPWTEERPLAVALYVGAGELAREMGAREVSARSVLHTDDYPYEAGYRWRFPSGWYLEATRSPYHRKEPPTGGWRRVVALLGALATPSFRDIREAGRRTDGSRRSRPR